MRLVYLAFGWTAGILLAANHTGGTTVISVIWLGLALLACVSAWLLWSETSQRIAGVTLVAFALGGLRMSLVPATSDIARYNNMGGLTIEGVVVSEPDVRDTQTQVQVAAETITRA